MRKLKLQVQMSVDGFIAGVNGEMDWMVLDWDDELMAFISSLTEPVDTIVLGRKLAEGFIPHWAGVAADSGNPEHTAGTKFTDTKKVVFSRTLDNSLWNNTVLAKGELATEINTLKNLAGGDMIAYGGSEFVSDLIKHKLVDELYLFINPVALGKGLPIFNTLESKQSFVLEKSKAFPCGIVLTQYRQAI